MSHILLGVPTSRLHQSARSAGPILASHFYDLQIPSIPDVQAALDFESDNVAHTGPPAVNVEVKLLGKKVAVEGGEPLEGSLWASGPAMLQLASGDTSKAER